MIREIKGQNGKLLVYDDRLEISRSTIGGFVSQGGSSGNRSYFYKDITSFEYKRPTFFSNGYFKIIVPGTIETNAKVGVLGSSMATMKDQNTIVLRAFTSKVGDETDSIYKIVMEKLSNAKKDGQLVPQTPSKLDELKKLGELRSSGILSEDEFQTEKAKLLNG